MSTQRILFIAPAHAVTRIFPALRDAGIEVGLAENTKGALAFIRKTEPEYIFSRPVLPDYTVEELLQAGQSEGVALPPIIVMTDKGTAEDAVHYMNMGIQDYWLEPLHVDKIKILLKNKPRTPLAAPRTSTLAGRRPEPLAGQKGPRIVGNNPTIRRVLALAKQVAPSKASVLISGESGTGKELFARTLHAWSTRSQGPFIAVNCAALPEHLLESELFGHEKGAFTGAIARKPGKFEMADGGTILLDEISEMDLALQAKLLRVLQEGEVDRVGGTDTLRVDVRVLATTNRHLADWVEQGKFRQDLFFRLNVIPLRIPSLVERGDDIFELANFFINLYVREYHLPTATLSPEAKEWLKQHPWPGNVRELQNLMERAVLLAGGGAVSPRHFLLENEEWPLFDEDANSIISEINTDECKNDPTHDRPEQQKSSSVGAIHTYEEQLQDSRSPAHEPTANNQLLSGAVIPLHEMERIMIMKGLEATAGNRTQAAELLGISVRTLRNKLSEYREQGLDL